MTTFFFKCVHCKFSCCDILKRRWFMKNLASCFSSVVYFSVLVAWRTWDMLLNLKRFDTVSLSLLFQLLWSILMICFRLTRHSWRVSNQHSVINEAVKAAFSKNPFHLIKAWIGTRKTDFRPSWGRNWALNVIQSLQVISQERCSDFNFSST